MNEKNLTGSGILPIIKISNKSKLNRFESLDRYDIFEKQKNLSNHRVESNQSTYYVVLYYDKFKKKYEDLGGHVDNNDKDIFNTASRESYEESATYLNIDENILRKCKYIRVKNYICFLVLLNNFNLNKAMKLLDNYKNIKHYNEMGNIKIIKFKDLIDNNFQLPISKRLIDIIKNIKNVKTNKIG